MKTYKQENGEPGDFIRETLEKEAGQKIFTIRVMEDNPKDQELELLVVFEDKSILIAMIQIETHEENLAARIKGNYI